MIKKMRYFSVLFLSLIIFLSCSTLVKKRDSDFKLRKYSTKKMENGLNLLFIHDEELPYLSLSLFFLNGYASDPIKKTGLNQAVLSLLDKGNKQFSAEQTAEQVDEMGADYGVSVSADFSTVEMEGLSWQEDKLLKTFSDIVLEPNFQNVEIKRYKEKTISLIKQNLDRLSALADEAIERFYYEDHPYASRASGKIVDVQGLNRADILNHYKRYVTPQNAWLVIVGKYSDQIEEKINTYFSQWKSSQVLGLARIPEIQTPKGREILFIDVPDAAQTEIRIGHKGTDRNDPDHLATIIANSVLGQGFMSRLMDKVRDQLGLTYGISSRMSFRLMGGLFSISTFTKNETVGKALKETLSVYGDFKDKGISSKELSMAKKYMIGQFPQLVETAEKLAYNLMILRIFGIQDSYLSSYSESVQNVTLAQVQGTIQKNFDPQNLKIVVVGPKEKILDQIKDLGKIKILSKNEFAR